MENFLMVFYILFFATGFMGGAALFLLSIRVRSRLLRPLLAFQFLFLIATGLIVLYFYLESRPGGLAMPVSISLLVTIVGINAAVWGMVILLIRRISPPPSRRKGTPATAELLAWLVIAHSIANMALMLATSGGGSSAELASPAALDAWRLGGYILSGLAMAAFGITARGTLTSKEPAQLRSLMRAYGTIALIFAPTGVVEYTIETAGIPWLSYISLEHFFFLAWNVVSMSAAVRLFKPSSMGTAMLDSVPEERVQALGLSLREAEMAVLIARGLANKEIAAELNISPATVRTHIYNLYQKADARSRVELLNKLRS